MTGEAKERFGVVGEFEKEMMRLSKHSLVCTSTLTRMRNTAARMEEEEEIMDRRLMEARN